MELVSRYETHADAHDQGRRAEDAKKQTNGGENADRPAVERRHLGGAENFARSLVRFREFFALLRREQHAVRHRALPLSESPVNGDSPDAEAEWSHVPRTEKVTLWSVASVGRGFSANGEL